MTLTSGGNLLVGTTTDAGFRLDVNGTGRFSGSVTATGNAATTPAFIANNPSAAGGTAQHYIDFTAGATVIGRILRGNGASGLVANGLNIDNFDGCQIRLNQLGGSGGSFNVLGGNVGIGTSNATGQSADNRVIQIYGAGVGNRAQIHFVNSDSGESTTDGSFIGIDFSRDFYIINRENAATVFENNGSERFRITSGGNVLIGTTTDNGARLQVNGSASIIGNTYSEGLYIASGQITQGASATNTFYTFSNTSINRVFLITLRQSGSGANNVVAIGFTFGGSLGAYNIIQDNTNPVLFLTISASGLGLRLTTGSGFGLTTWDWTITQIK
jgi:hypothetical protein